jgi:putative phosphoesterase
MKILVLSDSHGVMKYMRQAVLCEQPDQIIHLGDCLQDAEHLSEEFWEIPVLRLTGNCDYAFPQCGTLIRTIDSITFFLTHGDRYSVKYGYQRAEYAAREAGAQVLLFGHTHVAYCEYIDGLWMMNPGACNGYGKPGYGIVQTGHGEVKCFNQLIV